MKLEIECNGSPYRSSYLQYHIITQLSTEESAAAVRDRLRSATNGFCHSRDQQHETHSIPKPIGISDYNTSPTELQSESVQSLPQTSDPQPADRSLQLGVEQAAPTHLSYYSSSVPSLQCYFPSLQFTSYTVLSCCPFDIPFNLVSKFYWFVRLGPNYSSASVLHNRRLRYVKQKVKYIRCTTICQPWCEIQFNRKFIFLPKYNATLIK